MTVKPGDVFRADCREWFDGAIHNDDSADDVRNAPLPGVHVLSGPFRVEGAEPGDLLIVDILEIDACDQEDAGPFSGMGWGYTGVFATTERRRLPHRAVPRCLQGDLGLHGRRRHLAAHPGVLVRGHPSPRPDGYRTVGRAAREVDEARNRSDRHRPPACAAAGAAAAAGQRHPGNPHGRRRSTGRLREAARTAPPRENGGNQDIKNFTAGTRVFYPVFVDGANLSLGDLHFSQGDGEITFCGAIEMGGFMDLHVDLIKGGMADVWGLRERDLHARHPRPAVLRVDCILGRLGGLSTASSTTWTRSCRTQRACHHAIDYLMKFGYTDIQAYMILGSAPIEGRFSGVVDIPNSCATVYIPRSDLRLRRRPVDRQAAPGEARHAGAQVRKLTAHRWYPVYALVDARKPDTASSDGRST